MSPRVKKELVIIGGGPAGLAAALAAREAGIHDIVILERNSELGGILQQCIHNGFGLHRFKEELTGPEYAERYISRVKQSGIETYLNTMVIELTASKEITAVNPKHGLLQFQAESVILAMGCRERTRGTLNIPGTRPAGIFNAGTAQRYINMEGFMPGRTVVILGSGDIGLIMARRLTLEGAKVQAVIELLPYPAGLVRNIVQCLDDFGIPLYLGATVTEIHGQDRIEGVTMSRVDDTRRPIRGTETYIPCDTLLLSVGLIPENELSSQAGISIDPVTGGPKVNADRETSIPGVFACGNVLHVHDLVDYVSEEAEIAGKAAARYLNAKGLGSVSDILLEPGDNVRYIVPHVIGRNQSVDLYMRVQHPETDVVVQVGEIRQLAKKKVIPSEMLKVRLSAEALAKHPVGRKLRVDVKKGDEPQ